MKKPETANGRINIDLDIPVKRGDTSIDSVQLRRPQSGELRGLNLMEILNMDVTALHKLLPRITAPGLTEQEISQLDPADLVQMGTGVSNFFVPKSAQESDSLTA